MKTIIQQVEEILEKISEATGFTREYIGRLIPVFDEELIKIFDQSFNVHKIRNDKKWSKCSEKSLMAVRPLMHPEWEAIYNDPVQLSAIVYEAANGVTFGFFWKDGKLCWER